MIDALGPRNVPGWPDRVLTLRELIRATLARQLLLERKRLSPKHVVEHVAVRPKHRLPEPWV